MSELIDRIFDVEKISGEINTILINLNSLTTAINSAKENVNTISTNTRKSKGIDDLVEQSKKLNDEFTKGQKVSKTWQDEVANLNAKTEQLTGAEKAAAIEIAKARLELQAAQKSTKETALAEIELTATNKNLAGSYNALVADLKNATKEYKAMGDAEKNSAQGKELLKKIQDTQVSLKATDASMGNYQRNVGNYSESFKPLMSTFENLMKTQGKVQGTAADMMGFFKGSKSGFDVFQSGVGMSDESLKVLAKNPIMAILSIIIVIFNSLKDAIGSSSKATNTLKEAMAPLNAAMTVAKNVTVAVLQVFLDAFLAVSKFTTAIYAFVSGNDKYTKSVQDAMDVERERQALVANARKLIEDEAQGNLEVAKLRDKVTEKEKYTRKEREQFLREAIKLDGDMANAKRIQAIEEYNNLVKEQRRKEDLNNDDYDAKTAAYAKMFDVETEYYQKTRRMKTQAATFNITEDAAEAKAKEEAVKAETEHADKIIAARRRLIDSQFALMKDSETKSLAMSNEKYSRELEDANKNGVLTTNLKKNILKVQEQDAQKIKNEWSLKRLNDSIKFDEVEISHMEKNGEDTLKAKKALLKKQMDAEILAGGDLVTIQLKYQYLSQDLENESNDKKVEAFKKTIQKQADLLKDGYEKQERDLKKQYSKGLISKEDYEKELAKIQLDSLLAVNNQTIAALEKELENFKGSAEKKEELSNKLKELKIANENAVTDATIKANDDKVKADKDATAKRMEVAKALMSAANEIFGAIADYQIKQSEQKVEALEKELEASDNQFAGEQENLDNAIMSDETRAVKQNEINTKKAAADKVIQDKIQAEKIKQAKWERDKNIANAIITAGLAILTGLNNVFPLNLIAVALATTLGAIQVASIMSTPLPAYEKGGTTGQGLALWGEVRPEVAVTPSGQTFLAETPTITNFDAGTKIYKSVSDYENSIGQNAVQQMVFDYDKFGEKMPQNNIILDGNGLWSIVNKENERRTLINRRYSSK